MNLVYLIMRKLFIKSRTFSIPFWNSLLQVQCLPTFGAASR